ncbi:MAG: hypothetical protein C0407_19295 [Desulfobacca sp.]|nr:hypothetical protein [Desulfobacca sp.]
MDGECQLPPLCKRGQRILEIRGRIVALKEIVDPGSILRMYRATVDDLELLAEVEIEIQRLNPPSGSK